MAEFNTTGQIRTGDYMSAERKRKGFCTTCRGGDPIKCFNIKKRLGGLRREHIPLTDPGKVFNGICLVCHPDQNPDKPITSSRLHDDHHRHRLHDNSYADQNAPPHNNHRARISINGETFDTLTIPCQKNMTLHQQESVQFTPNFLKRSSIKIQEDDGTIISDMTSQQELEISSTPKLSALREFVEMFIQAGEDAEAINQITQALIIDNANTMKALDRGHAGAKPIDLVLFCLTTLWVLANKNNENKHEIVFADLTFAAVLEAMEIHHDNIEVQARGCGILWSLCMDPEMRKYVAHDGGCYAIVNAMLMHMEADTVQVTALGALEVLSSDSTGKASLRPKGVLQIVADIMQRHLLNPTIQVEGCKIMSNLVVDDTTQGVDSVTNNEVEAVVKGILAHPDSLKVHEAACFALRRLASAAANVELIRRNSKTTVSLELAFQKHPDEVGINILTLFDRCNYV